jgi:anhydro-N-acetylmuramic acid kinase
MKVLGMISGTSHDGIDVAIVDFRLEGDVLHGRVVHADSAPYDPALRTHLVATLPPAELRYADACELDTGIGQAFAAVAADAIEAAGPVDWICSHGQTVFHWVEGGHALGTLQLGQPAWIAERTGVPVIADVRARDVAAGGHGAPLASLMDILFLAGLPGNAAALNLGGISNMTVLRHLGGPIAYDIGPSNALIDAAVRRLTDDREAYDDGGRLGAAGRVDEALLRELLDEPYYALPAPRSTGKELFNAQYLDAIVARHPAVGGPDLVATLTALTARTVAAEVAARRVDTLVCSGGGCANPTLMRMLREACDGVDVRLSSDFGAPTDTKEAILFALIGWHTVHGLRGAVASCTGASGERVLGALIPGRDPLRLPEPAAAAPRALVLEAPVR